MVQCDYWLLWEKYDVASRGEYARGELIFQSNAITDGVYKITLDEFRLLNLAISKISRHDKPEKRIRITTKSLLKSLTSRIKTLKIGYQQLLMGC